MSTLNWIICLYWMQLDFLVSNSSFATLYSKFGREAPFWISKDGRTLLSNNSPMANREVLLAARWESHYCKRLFVAVTSSLLSSSPNFSRAAWHAGDFWVVAVGKLKIRKIATYWRIKISYEIQSALTHKMTDMPCWFVFSLEDHCNS